MDSEQMIRMMKDLKVRIFHLEQKEKELVDRKTELILIQYKDLYAHYYDLNERLIRVEKIIKTLTEVMPYLK